jgi:hypothetical protein
MTKRTRVFLGVACGILVVGLGTGLVTAYVGGFQNLVILGGTGPTSSLTFRRMRGWSPTRTFAKS